MREIRQSGSEGGGGDSPYPYPYFEGMGSKRPALGGVQRRSLWLGFGVKPRAQMRLDAGLAEHMVPATTTVHGGDGACGLA
jgi:hypothetical protein